MHIDIAIIGSGPAGLTAALYAARAGWKTTLFEKLMPGGQMNTTPEIANYPGLPNMEGLSLSEAMAAQLKPLGVRRISGEVTSLQRDDVSFALIINDEVQHARAVIFAAGASRKKLGITGEDMFIGRGVGYCAVCDGQFFAGKPVAVIGGGNTALEDALYMTKICPEVHIIHRRNEFRGARLLQNHVDANDKIIKHLGFTPTEIAGEHHVERLLLQSVDGTQQLSLNVAAVFIAVGSHADSQLIASLVKTDAQGRVMADESCQTTLPGLFVAGDVRAKPLYQIVTATADGANAATSAGQYLEALE